MSKLDQPNSTIEHEAASWVAQLDGDSMTDADRLALREWASRSPRHLSELRRMGDMWLDIDQLLEDQLAPLQESGSILKTLTSIFQIKPGYTLAAASLLILVASIGVLPWHAGDQPRAQQIAYSVPAGDNRHITLADGSTVHINTNSLIEVDFGPNKRIVRLIRGEAHFAVTHDARRPFIVYAGGNTVRAVGTAFVVRVRQDQTSVLVTEGKVKLAPLNQEGKSNTKQPSLEILPKGAPDYQPALILAGQTAIIDGNGAQNTPHIQNISEQILERELAWRDGLIVFNGQELQFVVNEVSRYTQSNIVIVDPNIRQLPIGGVFEAEKIDSLLGALEASFGIDVVHIDENLIHLRKRRSHEP